MTNISERLKRIEKKLQETTDPGKFRLYIDWDDGTELPDADLVIEWDDTGAADERHDN